MEISPIIAFSNNLLFLGRGWTASEFNLFLVMFSYGQKKDFAGRFQFSVSQLMKITQKDWNYGLFTKKVQDVTVCERLTGQVLTYARNCESYISFTIFHSIEYDNGIISFSFHPEAIPYLRDIGEKNFTQVMLNEVLNLPTLPSKILFLTLKKEEYKINFLLKFKIPEYKKLIGTPMNIDTNLLIQSFVSKPLNELQNKLKNPVKFSTIKEGKRIAEIEFSPLLNENIVWNKILQHIKNKVSMKDYNTWFQPLIPLSLTGTSLTIIVASIFVKEHLENIFFEELRSAMTTELGKQAKLFYKIKT